MTTKEKILELKCLKDVVILAHYYVDGEVQEIADYVGDSYGLAKKAEEVSNSNILFCGVSFMGESAKILNPDKTVIMPDMEADCPMAHMVTVDKIREVKEKYPDAAVVCYVNSSADIKAASDVCVTSSNALRVVKNLSNKKIFFIPDMNLAHYIAKQMPEKEFIFNDGFCPVHKEITLEDVENAKKLHPEAKVLTHPECTEDVVKASDFVGSTKEIIDFAKEDDCDSYIVCTEIGIFYDLLKEAPEKKYYSSREGQICPGMKMITLEKVLTALTNCAPMLTIDEEVAKAARQPLEKMLEYAKITS